VLTFDKLLILDRRLSARVVRFVSQASWLRILAVWLTHTGDSVLWLVIAVVAIFWGNNMWRALGNRMLLGTLAASLATWVLKWTFRRQRPPDAQLKIYSRLDQHAFPSGHAGRGACLTALLAPVLPLWGGVGLVAWTLLVGLSRVGLAMHLLSDIVGGWITGLVVGGVLLWLGAVYGLI